MRAVNEGMSLSNVYVTTAPHNQFCHGNCSLILLESLFKSATTSWIFKPL